MFKQFLFLAFTFCTAQLFGQIPFVAVGGCTTAEAISGTPNYEVDLWEGPFYQIDYVHCRALISPFASTLVAKYNLEKFDKATGHWLYAAGPQISPKFNNLAHGTYRITVSTPKRFANEGCQGGFEVYNGLGQYLGHWGTYTNGGFATSNPVVVGKTVPADIAYTWVDGGNGDLLPSGFDYKEIVTMNTNDCKNFDLYWLAIFENTPPYRYWSQGWNPATAGTGLGNLNLTTLAGIPGFPPTFGTPEGFGQYTVQFAIENKACVNESWNNLDQTFIVCPFGTGCREGLLADTKTPSIYPNPASGSLQINNLKEGEYQLSIVDLSGRAIQTIQFQAGSEISLNEVPAGMYVATVMQNGAKVFAEKLVINP